MNERENPTKKYEGRSLFLLIIVAVFAVIIVARLINMQIIDYDTYLQRALRKTSSTEVLVSQRGEIYDRNGVPLVTNRLCYDVILSRAQLPSDRQNEVLLSLLELIDEEALTYTDNFPFGNAPYEYYTSDDADIQASFDSVKKRLIKTVEAKEDITAGELMEKLCKRYSLTDLTEENKRLLAPLLYDMEYKGFSKKTPYTFASDVDMEIITVIKEDKVTYAGADIVTSSTREYTTDYCSHILGRVGYISESEMEKYTKKGYSMNDLIGIGGVEYAMEDSLRGIDGSRLVESDAQGNVNIISEELPQNGDDVYLTIDLKLQAAAEESLERNIKAIAARGRLSGRGADADAGAVVAMDVKNGDILALASYPTFSLKNYSRDFAKNNTDKTKPFLNRAIAGAYAPGSTFKMTTAIAALESGAMKPSTTYHCDGIYDRFSPQKFYCWQYTDLGRGHGTVNVSGALQGSCNEYFYEAGYLTGIDTLIEWEKKFGFGQKTGIEIGGEVAGTIAGPDVAEKLGQRWYAGNTVQASIGQSYNLMTPLQLVSYVSTVVNGGERWQPHLIRSAKDSASGKMTKKPTSELVENVEFSDSTYKAVINGMKAVVNEGGTAASVFRNYPVAVGGKSGTAQVAKGTATGVFVCFAPADDPEIAIAVVVEHGGSGNNVAPIVRDIMDVYFGLDTAQTESNILLK